MHDIEPHFRWRDLYVASEDKYSPFYGRKYSEFHFTHKIYNYYIHPQWDAFGSATLYMKILYADYELGYAMIEMIGEWNDTLYNDIMFLKRNVVDHLSSEGISKYIFFCDNVLNFHAGEDDYYAEWAEEMQDERGWAVLINTHTHVAEEMHDARLHYYLHFGEDFNHIGWQAQQPGLLFGKIEAMLHQGSKRLSG